MANERLVVTLYSDGTKRTEIIAQKLDDKSIRYERIERPWHRNRLPAIETETGRYEGVPAIQAYFLHGR